MASLGSRSPNVFARMTGWQVLEVNGPDSRDFLNRLTSANFNRLEPGQFTPGTLLNPTGKITLYFKALQLDSERYLLLVPPQPTGQPAAQAAFEAFERLHFREQLRLTPLSEEWAYLRVLASDTERVSALGSLVPEPGRLKTTHDGRIVLNENRWTAPPVKLDLGILAPAPKLSAIIQVFRQSAYDELPDLEGYRLRASDPAAPADLNASTIPLEAKLDDAVHENKGCYPGQEVIERIRAQGAPPKCLATLRGQGEPPATVAGSPEPSIVLRDGTLAGVLTSAAADPIDGGWVGIGYVKRVFAKPESEYTVNGQSVTLKIK